MNRLERPLMPNQMRLRGGGEKGILLGTPSWKPTVFIGCMIDGTDHKEPVVDIHGGVDLAIVVSVHRKAGTEGVSGDQFVTSAEWTMLVERLLGVETEFTVIDHFTKRSGQSMASASSSHSIGKNMAVLHNYR